jgi:hypothetical protein
MHRTIPTVIVAASAALREELSHKLGPPDFGVVISKPSLSAVGSREFPRDERCLLVIETAETALLLAAQIVQLKQHYPMSQIVLLGQD